MPRRPQPRHNGQVPKGLKRPKAWHRQTDWIRFARAMRLWPKEAINVVGGSDTPRGLVDPWAPADNRRPPQRRQATGPVKGEGGGTGAEAAAVDLPDHG